MKIKLTLILLISALTFCFTNAKAQTSTASFSPSQLAAAQRLMETSGVLDNMQKIFANVIQTQAQQIPEEKRAAFITVMNKFFARYINNDEIKKAFVPIYASEYSETEMNQIADFLSTPAGKAMTAKQPELMNKGMQWGQKIGENHKEELEAMMKEAFDKK